MTNNLIKRFSIFLKQPKEYRSQSSSVFKARDGKSIPVDEAFVAWSTGTLEQMIEATAVSYTHLTLPTTPYV